MGGTSEFRFPLPGGRPSTSSGAMMAGEMFSQQRRKGGLRAHKKLRRPMSLDGSTQSISGADQGEFRRPRFMSISLSEAEPDLTWPNELGGQGCPAFLDRRRHSTPSKPELQHRPSSPLLGREQMKLPEIPIPVLTPDSPSFRLGRSDSSSTLLSYYDAAQSPLAISQQTSASSARDMALRKGFPAINMSRDDFIPPRTSSKALRTNMSITQLNCLAPGVGRSPQLRLDLSTLFPKPQAPAMGLLSPRRLTHSPSAMSLASGSSTASWNDSNEPALAWTESEGLAPHDGRSSARKGLFEHAHSSTPVKTGKMLTGQPSSIHHSRRCDDSRISDPSHSDTEALGDHTKNSHIVEGDPIRADRSHVTRKDAPSKKAKTVIIGASKQETNITSLFSRRLSPDVTKAQSYSQTWDNGSIASASSRLTSVSTSSTTSIFSTSNLHEQSVLYLSSSEDEDTPDDDDTDMSIRNEEAKNDEVRSMIRRAQESKMDEAAFEVYTRAKQLNKVDETLESPWKSTSVAATPFRPAKNTRTTYSGHHHNHSLSQLKPRELNFLDEPLRPKSAGGPATKGRSSWLSIKPSKSALVSGSPRRKKRNSRVMVVTQEEEALLQALRHKNPTLDPPSSDTGLSATESTSASASSVFDASTDDLDTSSLDDAEAAEFSDFVARSANSAFLALSDTPRSIMRSSHKRAGGAAATHRPSSKLTRPRTASSGCLHREREQLALERALCQDEAAGVWGLEMSA
ncbi:MAG: hypothetical protein M1833_004503 [Piccolia ochrophora]|nr:MAG: hypothetical protein M1833_004503 [Piccolia ochrophora]